ncbi:MULTISPECIES: hypothetical protein [Serratia]|uniref:hypothetical protein n=1 Tax=Serratia TaxID=613 RepID=UPI000E0FD632|nr:MULTISPECIES: hypothetical protein [Serratia]RYM66280.1 hypothetical protein BSR03_01540 [Serratia proteamaculans]
MEFNELPADIQKTAAHTLHSVLLGMGGNIESEPAKKLARNINEAFVELYFPPQSPSDGMDCLAASLKKLSETTDRETTEARIARSVLHTLKLLQSCG